MAVLCVLVVALEATLREHKRPGPALRVSGLWRRLPFLSYLLFFFSFFYPLISYKYTEACVSLIINFSVDSD